MKISCLINNHNYRDFVVEAIESALAQSHPVDEVFVIDDGSTDGSQSLLRSRYGSHPCVRIVTKPQAGQLSCFNLGSQLVTGDIVFFLDADDRFTVDYVKTVLDRYVAHPEVDFVSVARKFFGQPSQRIDRRRVTRDEGISVLAALYRKVWVGSPTSCISMRTNLLKKVAVYPDEAEWQTRADDVLIFGASIVGGHKFHIDERLVEYRVHGNNAFARKKFSVAEKMQYALRVNRMIAWFESRLGYDRRMMAYLAYREFRTWKSPTFREFLRYVGILSRAQLPMADRCEQSFAMLVHYAASRLRRSKEVQSILMKPVRQADRLDEGGIKRAA